MKVFFTLAFASIIAGFLGWKWPYEEQLDKANDELRKANESLQQYQKIAQEYKTQWDTFGKQMVEASDKIDPLYLKELFRKNETLEALNQDLKDRLSSTAYGGVLFLDTQQLVFRIGFFKGDLAVSADVDPEDSEPNVIFREQLRSTDPSLNVAFDVGQKLRPELIDWFNKKGGNRFENMNDLGNSLLSENFGPRIDERYKNGVTQAFNTFLQMNAYESPKAESQKQWFLRDYLRRSGFHRIAMTVKNLEPDKPWDITFNLIKVDGKSGKEELLKTFQFNPQTGKLSDAFTIWVKYRDQNAATDAAPGPFPTSGQ